MRSCGIQPGDNSIRNAQDIFPWYQFGNYLFKITQGPMSQSTSTNSPLIFKDGLSNHGSTTLVPEATACYIPAHILTVTWFFIGIRRPIQYKYVISLVCRYFHYKDWSVSRQKRILPVIDRRPTLHAKTANAGLLLTGTLGKSFRKICIKIQQCSSQKMNLKMAPTRLWPFLWPFWASMC